MRSAFLTSGRGQRIRRRPSDIEATLYRRAVDTRSLCPLRQCERLSVVDDDPVGSNIPGLFLGSCPSDIAWLIAACTVDSVKRVARGRLRPHVRVERFERAFPSFAYRDASATVAVVLLMMRVSASLDHPAPNPVFGRSCLAMGALGNPRAFSLETAATLRVPRVERIGSDHLVIPALTSTVPAHPGPSLVQADHRQSSKYQTGQVAKIVHGHNKTSLGKASREGWGWRRERRLSAGNYSALALCDCRSILP